MTGKIIGYIINLIPFFWRCEIVEEEECETITEMDCRMEITAECRSIDKSVCTTIQEPGSYFILVAVTFWQIFSKPSVKFLNFKIIKLNLIVIPLNIGAKNLIEGINFTWWLFFFHLQEGFYHFLFTK